MTDFGAVAYDAYSRASNGKSLVSGAELPAWIAVPAEIQSAWQEAAAAVLRANSEARE